MRENMNGKRQLNPVRSTCQMNVNRIAKTVYNGMNFGALSSTTYSNKLVVLAVYSPFLAPAL